MIDYNSIIGRAQDNVDKIHQAAAQRDLAELAKAHETTQSTHNGLHIPTIEQIKCAVTLNWLLHHEMNKSTNG